MFVTSFLIGFAVGYLIGSIISIVIDVYNEYLTAREAKKRVEAELSKAIKKIKVDMIEGETISAKAIGFDGEEVADVTINAHQGHSLYKGQEIY